MQCKTSNTVHIEAKYSCWWSWRVRKSRNWESQSVWQLLFCCILKENMGGEMIDVSMHSLLIEVPAVSRTVVTSTGLRQAAFLHLTSTLELDFLRNFRKRFNWACTFKIQFLGRSIDSYITLELVTKAMVYPGRDSSFIPNTELTRTKQNSPLSLSLILRE